MINKKNYFKDKTHLSSHALQDFMKCEYLHKCKMDGKVKDLKSVALTFGSAVHDKISGDFDNNYFVGNKRSKAEKEEYQKQIEAGKEHLTPSTMKAVEACLKEFERQPLFKKYAEGMKEQIVTTTLKNIPVKGMIDVLNLEKKFIVDWKTTRDLKFFDPTIYFNQLAFYRMIVEKKYGVKCDCIMGVIDKTPINHFRMYKIEEYRLDACFDDLLEALELYKLATESGVYSKTKDDNNCLDCVHYSRCKYSIQRGLKIA